MVERSDRDQRWVRMDAVEPVMVVSAETPECAESWPNVAQRSPAGGAAECIAAALAEPTLAAMRSPPITTRRRHANHSRRNPRPTPVLFIRPAPLALRLRTPRVPPNLHSV